VRDEKLSKTIEVCVSSFAYKSVRHQYLLLLGSASLAGVVAAVEM
jgi:hypothetical protein